MPKPRARHGKSSAVPVPSRTPSPGRISKSNPTNRQIKPSTVTTALDDLDKTKLHPHYRSPIQTRLKNASASKQQQPQASSSVPSVTTIQTNNEFEMLSGDEEENNDGIISSSSDDDDDYDGSPRGQPKGKESKTTAKARRPPPIFVVDTIADRVDELLEGHRYCLKIGKKNVQVITLDKAEFDKVLIVLKMHNVKYFTFDPAETVPTKIVLQGYKERPISELSEHLADVKVYPRDIKVLSKTTTVTGTHVLYLLYFDRGTIKLQDLRRYKSLDGFWVTWRYFSRNSTDAAQCHRCQKFGHGSRNCNLPPRCVKCGETHLTEKCSLPQKASLGNNVQQQRSRLKCANCEGNHTANYRGCAARKAYVEEQAKMKKKLPASRPPPRSSSTVPAAGHGAAERKNSTFPPGWGGSYARVAASAAGTDPEQAAVSGDDIFTLPEFFALAGVMLTRFRACRNKAEQFMALGELMMKYVYSG